MVHALDIEMQCVLLNRKVHTAKGVVFVATPTVLVMLVKPSQYKIGLPDQCYISWACQFVNPFSNVLVGPFNIKLV
jgi:hypothetical protein